MISSLDPRPSIDSLWPMEQNNLCPRIPAGELETLESRVSHLAMGRQPDLEISPHPSVSSVEEQSEDGQSTTISNLPSQVTTPAQEGNTSIPQELVENNRQRDAGDRKQGRYFYYDPPLYEETGIWIPVSVPPMSESDHEEWRQGFGCNGGFFPEEEMSWGQFVGEDKELTMWDVLIEMLLAARGKMGAISSGELQRHGMSFISGALFEQAWKEMAQVLTEANFGNMKEILEREPPKWLADSAASSCMLCGVRFHPIMCSRHHCRFCGGIFCSECSRGRSLLPVKFRTGDPQRVCDVCYVRLESVQSDLRDQVSPAAQLPTHDLTDLSTLRSWVNFPWGQSMEYEIYKATNTIRGYNKVVSRRPERSIPDAILRDAKGLAILTIVKVGMMTSYNIGTGIVIARREDGSWSPPSAISSFGAGWGPQGGGELTDFIIVLRTKEAVKTFSGNVHFSMGAGFSAAVGIVGRAAEADVRAGDGGCAASYTYSCSKGAFVGCSLEGSMVITRTSVNSCFYGSPSIKASDILLGSLPRPPAAAVLYHALSDLFQKLNE
ncbi:uncharacterized protein LOC131245439 isoform X1 [Magnolia sinica]|uniref:uncharacterized protein LOC131245439 isoform X1 n=1 Tax=Magnolia sinica TaxID=86752 RepID=UPI0026580F7E|nr:uncharacterized protein LOC131245439 isoform X1 [Magnolia sinica]